MRFFDFRLSNNEDWFLKTEDSITLENIKYTIANNQWIKLNSSGRKSIPNGFKFIPEEADIQTCNIITVVEDVDYQKNIDYYKQHEKEQMVIIEEIEKYEFNFKMKFWMWKKEFLMFKDDALINPLLRYNKEFLNTILTQCKKYKCKLK